MNMLQQLQKAIEERGISRKDILGKTSISENTLANLINSNREGFNSRTLEEVAAALGMKFVLIDAVPEIYQELIINE